MPVLKTWQSWLFGLRLRKPAERYRREVDHRVKNSIQFIHAQLRLQANSSSEPAVREGLLNAADRLTAIVRVHEQLYRGDPARELDLRDFLDRLSRDAERVMEHLKIE